MKSLDAPEHLIFYVLISQSSTSLYFNPTGTGQSGVSYGTGFYGSRDDAEKARTLAVLGDKNTPPYQYHIFELQFPNPAYQVLK